MEKSVLAGNGIVKMETGDRSMATGNQRLQGVAEVNTAYGAKSRKHGTGISIQRLLLLMAAVMMALAAFTACFDEDENNSDPDENGNGGGGGVAGKRLKSMEWTCAKPLNQNFDKTVYTYDNDGKITRSDMYQSSKLAYYDIYTHHPDGTVSKFVTYDANGTVVTTFSDITYFYNSDKTLQKIQSTVDNSAYIFTQIVEYTYENGKKVKEVITTPELSTTDWVENIINYDNQGRRTTTIETGYYVSLNMVLSMTHTRIYNTDGTIQKVTCPLSFVDDTPVTLIYTLENGKIKTGTLEDQLPW